MFALRRARGGTCTERMGAWVLYVVGDIQASIPSNRVVLSQRIYDIQIRSSYCLLRVKNLAEGAPTAGHGVNACTQSIDEETLPFYQTFYLWLLALVSVTCCRRACFAKTHALSLAQSRYHVPMAIVAAMQAVSAASSQNTVSSHGRLSSTGRRQTAPSGKTTATRRTPVPRRNGGGPCETGNAVPPA